MDKISVIIPCYNVEKYIDRCLESLINQTIGYSKLEIICVDDASTDNTRKKLKDWEGKYPEQFIIIECDTNAKQGAARNIGLKYASASWIAFLDSDDWIDESYFELLTSYIDDECDVIACGCYRDYGDGIRKYAQPYSVAGKLSVNNTEDRKKLLINRSLSYSAWGKLIRKSFLTDNDIFFPESLSYEDIVWGSLIHLYTVNAFVLEECLYHYFVNENSTVIAKDELRHIDQLTIQMKVWREWEGRGFLDDFYDELQYEYFYSGYLPFIKILAIRFSEPSYEMFNLLQCIARKPLADAECNKYLAKESLPELHYTLLRILYAQLSKSEFSRLMESVRSIGL